VKMVVAAQATKKLGRPAIELAQALRKLEGSGRDRAGVEFGNAEAKRNGSGFSPGKRGASQRTGRLRHKVRMGRWATLAMRM